MINDKAIVDKNSKLDSSVEVGPFSIIGKEVKIGKNVKILSHVNITGDTSISDECEIYSFASIGSNPQDLKFKGEKTKLIIGKKNKIREYVTINPGTAHGGGLTSIGDNCLIAANCQIIDCNGHDLSFDNVDNRINTQGHAKAVVIENSVWLGTGVVVLPGVTIGRGSIISANSVVNCDVPPMCVAGGNPLQIIKQIKQ